MRRRNRNGTPVANPFRLAVPVRGMGERACYLEFCPECDAQVTVADERCPDCGATLQVRE